MLVRGSLSLDVDEIFSVSASGQVGCILPYRGVLEVKTTLACGNRLPFTEVSSVMM